MDRLPRPHGRYAVIIGQNMAKTGFRWPLGAKPEVEIWRRPDFSTQRPRLPIRSTIHLGVYLAPLWSYRGDTEYRKRIRVLGIGIGSGIEFEHPDTEYSISESGSVSVFSIRIGFELSIQYRYSNIEYSEPIRVTYVGQICQNSPKQASRGV